MPCKSGALAAEFIRHFIVLGTKDNGSRSHMLHQQELGLCRDVDLRGSSEYDPDTNAKMNQS